MDHASDVRETAAFVRRVVLRTLTVVGGVAAGTALAWCLSTASASAEAPTDPLYPADSSGDRNPVLAKVVEPLGDTFDKVAERLADPPAPPNPIKDVGDRIEEAAEPADALPAVDGIADTSAVPDTGLGRMVDAEITPPVTPPAPAVGKVAGLGVDPERTAERSATDRAYSDGMSRRGSPDPAAPPSLPDLPTWPAPFPPVPPSAPGHTGQAGNSSADSPLFAVLSWLDRAPGPGRGLTEPAIEATSVGRVGAQPGVAPD